MEPRGRNAVTTTLLAGAAGWLLIDLYLVVTHGLLFRDATPLEISQWDASNALGLAAFAGGVPSALLGLAMHFVVSIVWAALYVAAALRSRVLLERPLLAGTAFGLVVMLVMKFGLVPLGHAPHPASPPLQLLAQALAHVAGFGIPIAFIVRARVMRAPARQA